jgi:hypothetical protein
MHRLPPTGLWREIPRMKFFVRDEEKGLDAFLDLLYQDPNIEVYIPRGGELTPQSFPDESTTPFTVEDIGRCADLKVMEKTPLACCELWLRIDKKDWKVSPTAFYNVTHRLNLLRQVLEHARQSHLERRRPCLRRLSPNI